LKRGVEGAGGILFGPRGNVECLMTNVERSPNDEIRMTNGGNGLSLVKWWPCCLGVTRRIRFKSAILANAFAQCGRVKKRTLVWLIFTMTPRTFATLCKAEKESLLAMYFDGDSGSAVVALIRELNLSPIQSERLHRIVDGILADSFYGLLLGLDGAASIGGSQQSYQLRDEQGDLLTDGKLEGEAWEAFHNKA